VVKILISKNIKEIFEEKGDWYLTILADKFFVNIGCFFGLPRNYI